MFIGIFAAELTTSFHSNANKAGALKTISIAERQAAIENIAPEESGEEIPADQFEYAVELIKRYETLHTLRHWPYIGYGHLVQKGENFSRRNYSEKEAEEILRADLRKFCGMFKDYGKDSLLLGVLAYSVGPYRLLGAGKKMPMSQMLKKLENGNRDIRDEYISYCKYKGRTHKGLLERRIDEFESLYLN